MNCSCPNCNKTTQIPDSKIPKCGWPLRWKCHSCGCINSVRRHKENIAVAFNTDDNRQFYAARHITGHGDSFEIEFCNN